LWGSSSSVCDGEHFVLKIHKLLLLFNLAFKKYPSCSHPLHASWTCLWCHHKMMFWRTTRDATTTFWVSVELQIPFRFILVGLMNMIMIHCGGHHPVSVMVNTLFLKYTSCCCCST
jgi:hypothetical protein